MDAAGKEEPVSKIRALACVTGAGRQASLFRPTEVDTHSRLGAWASSSFRVTCVGSLLSVTQTGHTNYHPNS